MPGEIKRTPGPGAPVLDDALHAPVIFFDSVPAFGLIRGIVAMTLSTGRWLEIEGEVQVRPVVVGHLRMSAEGATALRDAIDKALLAATKVKGDPN